MSRDAGSLLQQQKDYVSRILVDKLILALVLLSE